MKEFKKKGEDCVAVAKLLLSKNIFSIDQYNSFFDFNNKINVKFSELTMLGLLSFSNPKFNKVEKSLSLAKAASTKIFIITEKDPLTTFSIASYCGLFSGIDPNINKIAVDESSTSKEF